jgi:hypothetical protein
MTATTLNLTEDQQQALLEFTQTFQHEYLPRMAAFHEHLLTLKGIPDETLKENAWIYKTVKWAFEHTADTLNSQE